MNHQHSPTNYNPDDSDLWSSIMTMLLSNLQYSSLLMVRSDSSSVVNNESNLLQKRSNHKHPQTIRNTTKHYSFSSWIKINHDDFPAKSQMFHAFSHENPGIFPGFPRVSRACAAQSQPPRGGVLCCVGRSSLDMAIHGMICFFY